MGSREKLALFNMLRAEIAGAVVLDAYAGTGALGIEALSCGASSVTFVEKAPQVAKIIRDNLRGLDEKLEGEVFVGSVGEFTENTALAGKYDLILADPPYDKFEVSEIAELAKLLKTGGRLVLSFPFQLGAPELSGLALQSARKYAAAGIANYRKLS